MAKHYQDKNRRIEGAPLESAAAVADGQRAGKKKRKKSFWQRTFPCKGDSAGQVILKLLTIIAFLVFLISAGVLLYQGVLLPGLNEKKAQELRSIYTQAQEETVSQEPGEDGVLPKFEPLLEVNADIKGWLTIPNTVIDYPVLQPAPGVDPEYYLYRDYTGQDNNHGSIFLDAASSEGTESKNIILHGHHMRDGQMFNNIMKYCDYDFYRTTPVFTFDSLHEEAQWKVVAVFKANVLASQGEPFAYLRGSFADDSDFLNYVYQVRERSIIDTGVTVNEDDQLITLSTCSYEFDDFRTVVVARKVRPGEDAQVDTSGAAYNPNPLYPDIWYETYGGTAPELTSFEEALAAGQISWYDGALAP